MPHQHVSRQDDHQLVAPPNLALRVDYSDAIPVAIKGDTEIAMLARHHLLQLHEVFGNGRIRMMRWEAAVNRSVYQQVAAGEPCRQPLHDLAGGAVARIPSHSQRS